ncbi:MAG: amino acid adenylation domain-containing protein [Clostridium sp.]|nr:amino acid adenylation domain-containing protein [Clostridium sp.]
METINKNTRNDLEEICKSYMEGKDVDWNKVYKKNQYKKVRLPTYEFEKRRCWLNMENEGLSTIQELTGKINYLAKTIPDEDVAFSDYLGILNDYSGICLLNNFHDNNIKVIENEQYVVKDLIKLFNVTDEYHRLFYALLDIMADQEFLLYEDKSIIFTKKAEKFKEKTGILDEMKKDILSNYPEIIHYMTLLDSCVKNLNDIISGKTLATNIIFGNENGNLVENIYKNNRYMDYYHKLLSSAVSEEIKVLKESGGNLRTIKILEIGSGTGGASKGIFESISKYSNIKYIYTDISKALVEYGREHYGDEYDFVDFKTLNIEKPLGKQGFKFGDYDIIVAFDVLHATKDINFTIKQAKKLLRKFGSILILEPTKVQHFSTLTFGTLEGWWLYKDENLRMKNSPLLNSETWIKVLNSNGFNGVDCIEKENGFEGFIIGESDGVYEKDISDLSISKEEKSSVHSVQNLSDVEKIIFDAWAEALGTDEIELEESFYDLGGDSIIAMKVVNSLNKALNIKLKINNLLNYDTIKSLSEYIKDNFDINTEIKESVKNKATMLSLNTYEEYLIEKTKKYTSYVSSSEQKRIYLSTMIQDKYSINYNLPSAFIIEGKLDKDKVQQAFNKIVERHESLRTNFEYENNECIQKIYKNIDFKVSYSKKNTEDYDSLLDEFVKPFDLEKDILIRVEIVEVCDNKYILMVDMHHIISDGMSINIVIDEFRNIYFDKELTPIKYGYKDYTLWQKEYAKTDSFKKEEVFWVNEFKDNIPVLNLPTDYQRKEVKDYKGDLYFFDLEKDLYYKLTKYASDKGTTLFNVCLSVFYVLLYKYSGQEDIVVGTALAGREDYNFENVIGMFVNTLPIRSKVSGSITYKQFLESLKHKTSKVFNNQNYQLEDIIDKLNIKRNSMDNPLFNVMFVMQNMGEFVLSLDDMKITSYDFKYKSSKFDMALMAYQKSDGIRFTFEYSTMLFKKKTIERMAQHYIEILIKVLKDDSLPLGKVNMLTDSEIKKITKDFNNSYMEYDKTKTVADLLNEVVLEYGEKTALVFGENKYSYKELDLKTNVMANKLKALGMGKTSRAAIIMDRSDNLILSMLSVMKTGACYMPVDPEYPVERIKYMLEDSSAEFIITEEKYKDIVEFNGNIVLGDNKQIYNGNDEALSEDIKPNNLLYIIYTSGTTGKPKGVMLEHRGIVNYKNHCVRDFKITEDKKVLSFASPSFDAFESEVYMAILRGAELHLTSKENLMDPKTLNDYIIKNRINVITVPPFLAERLDIDNSELDVLICAGSESRKSIADKLSKKVNYFNAYGPTEDTICTTVCLYDREKYKEYNTVPIGYPIPNHRVYILDKDKNVVPIGCPGELCVSSDSLAREYINRDDLNEEKFIENPYEEGTRMYRTGDAAKWSENGIIEYLGRIDRQVKIRGFRIELSEIEESLLKLDFIKSAAVIAFKDKNYIAAYYESDKEVKAGVIRQQLKKLLPNYMIPSYLIQVDEIPLTINGKVDANKLPKINMDRKLDEHEELEDKEKFLLDICRDILENESLSVQDDLFDFGLDSLKIIQILSEIRKDSLEISISDFFKYTRVEELYKCIKIVSKDDKKLNTEENLKVDISGYKKYISIENSKMQQVIKSEEIIESFNMIPIQDEYYESKEISGSIVDVNLEVDDETVINAVKNVIRKHDMFRASLSIEDKIWNIHRYNDEIDIPLIDLSDSKESIVKNEICSYLFYNQRIQKGNSLYSIVLIKERKDKYLVVLSAQHLIFDGVSNEILKNDVLNYCVNGESYEVKNSYKDYGLKIREGIKGMKEEEVIEKFKLNEFIKLKDNMEFGRLENNIGIYNIHIPITNKKIDIINESLDVVYKFSRLYFDIDKVPVLMVSRGREYDDNKYYDVIGNCIDVVPIVLDENKESKDINSNFKIASKHNINFVSLVKSEKYKNDLKKKMHKILQGSNIILNIQGAKLDIYNMFDEETYKDMKITRENMVFMVRYDMNEIELTCTVPYVSDDEKIKEIIRRNFI